METANHLAIDWRKNLDFSIPEILPLLFRVTVILSITELMRKRFSALVILSGSFVAHKKRNYSTNCRREINETKIESSF